MTSLVTSAYENGVRIAVGYTRLIQHYLTLRTLQNTPNIKALSSLVVLSGAVTTGSTQAVMYVPSSTTMQPTMITALNSGAVDANSLHKWRTYRQMQVQPQKCHNFFTVFPSTLPSKHFFTISCMDIIVESILHRPPRGWNGPSCSSWIDILQFLVFCSWLTAI